MINTAPAANATVPNSDILFQWQSGVDAATATTDSLFVTDANLVLVRQLPLTGTSYTYPFQSKYGGDELDTQPLKIDSAQLSPDGLTLEVQCPTTLRPGYVHEFQLPQLKSKDGTPLWHRMAYYTLNKLISD